MHFYIYATHSQGYFENLLHSLHLFHANYTIDGIGKTWHGYRQKLEGILQFAKKQQSNQVICILDAFDSLLIRDPHTMEISFRHSGKNIIYAHDHTFLYSNWFGKRYHEKKWGCARTLLNAGASIGYASTYVKIISRILEKLDRDHVQNECVDDQRELCLYYKYHSSSDNLAIDQRSTFFYLTMGLKPMFPKQGLPFVISAPGKQSLRLYIIWLRLKYPTFYQNIPDEHVLTRWEKTILKWKRWKTIIPQ